MSKKDRKKSKDDADSGYGNDSTEVILTSVSEEKEEENLENIEKSEVLEDQPQQEIKSEIKQSISSVEENKLEVPSDLPEVQIKPDEIKKIEYSYAVDEIEAYINHAVKEANHALAAELHKVNAILCDLNHTFLHLSGEAKLITSIILKKGRILKC